MASAPGGAVQGDVADGILRPFFSPGYKVYSCFEQSQ